MPRRSKHKFFVKLKKKYQQLLRRFLKLPRKGKREESLMDQTYRPNSGLHHLVTIFVTLFFAAILTACGGGGGPASLTDTGGTPSTGGNTGGTPVVGGGTGSSGGGVGGNTGGTPGTNVTGKVDSVSPCVIEADKAECKTTVVASVSAGAVNPTLKVGTLVYPLNVGTQTVSVTRQGEGSVVATVTHDGGVLDSSKSVVSACTSNTLWDTVELPTGKCTPKQCYAEVVTAFTGPTATIYVVNRTASKEEDRVKQATDLTKWTVPNANGWLPPPAKCAKAVKNNPDKLGRVRFGCTDPATQTYREVLFYPTTREMKSFGQERIKPEDFNTDNYVDVVTSGSTQPGWAFGEKVSGGWYFTYDNVVAYAGDIWFQPEGQPLPAPILVQADPFENGNGRSVKRFDVWSNSCTASQ